MIQRPHYFKGQFLKADDFIAEQQYHIQMRRSHNSSLHTWGVVDGLNVTADDAGIKITAGNAIDSDGKEIWRTEKDKNLPIPPSTANGSYFVVITYKEGYDPGSPYPPASDTEPDDSKYIRKLETGEPSLVAATPAPANEGSLVKLALVTITGGKVTGQLDNTVRRTAGSFRANGIDLEIRPVTKAGALRFMTGAPLTERLTIDATGKIGVGAVKPGFALQVGDADNVVDARLCIAGKGETGNWRQWTLRTGDEDGTTGDARAREIHKLRIRDEQANADRIVIDQDGNVGIGTTSPQEQMQIGEGIFKIGIGTTPADVTSGRTQSLWNVAYGTAYLGFNAVRTNDGWRRGDESAKRGASIIYNTLNGDLCFVTVEPEGNEYLSASDIVSRKRMAIDRYGNVGIGRPLDKTGTDKGFNGRLNVIGSGGVEQGLQFDNREIKFRGDGLSHFSIFANRVNNALTFDVSDSTLAMNVADSNIMTLAANGKVGIGTTDPKGRLSIFEPTGTVAGSNQGTILIDHDNAGGASSIVFRSKNNPGSDYGYIQYQDDSTVGGTGESSLLIIGAENDNADHVILKPSGNVGIGTTDPKAMLQVGKAASEGSPSVRIGWGANNEEDRLTIYSTDQYRMGLRRGSRDLKIFAKSKDNDGHIYLMPNDTVAMSLLSSGNVGIGTTNPDAMLSISQAQAPDSSDAIPAMRIQGGKGGASGGQKGGKGAPIVITAGEGGYGFWKGDGGFILLRPGKAGTNWGNPSDPANGKDGYVEVDGDVRVKGVVSGSSSPVGGNAARIQGLGAEFAFKCDQYDNIQVWNTSATAYKHFIINHPTDDKRHLVHATLEGPEGGVYYRGSARLKNGRAEIDLPHYFEALTHKELRTIILTNIGGFDRIAVEKTGEEKIKNGRFIVISEDPNSTQEFDWEVKASRADAPPFNVEPRKSDIKVGGFGPYTYEIVE